MISICVTGANGQLGNELRDRHEHLEDARFIFVDIEELDLCDAAAVTTFFNRLKPAVIVNCAAYTAVDQAETDSAKAMQLNADVPGLLARLARKNNTRLIHISTDYVFDGEGNVPLQEADPVNPQSVYGRSKLEGETQLRNCPGSVVIRTAWLYSAYGRNFVKTMLKLGSQHRSLSVVCDQTGTPTYAGDLANAILRLIRFCIKQPAFAGGLYHYANQGVCSWYDFAVAIMQQAALDCRVIPITTEQYPTPAPRPRYSVMNKSKIISLLGIDIPHWQASLLPVISRLAQHKS
jgi:dTDP-4-dehydrorhamnose reductase